MVRVALPVRGVILVAWIVACSGSGEKTAPDASAPRSTGRDDSMSSASCAAELCPSIPEAEACCVTPAGPCGFQRDNACWAMLPDFSMEAGSEASPDADAAPYVVDASSCPHEQACALACSSVDEGPCAGVAGFPSLCFARCCAETAALDARCAECVIAGLTPEIRCEGTCLCGVSFYRSPACVQLCQGAADAGDDGAAPLDSAAAADGSGLDGGGGTDGSGLDGG